jgi:enamine deaminase RidA (YjgF/YER057c/UK114 family)
MAQTIEARLAEKGITLPTPPAAAANYMPALVAGTLLFISGQLPSGPKGLAHRGKVGRDLTVGDAKAAAQLCALNILAQAKAQLGTLDRVKRCVRLNGYVNATDDFEEHPAVINGASDFIAEALGESGPHTRVAVGVSSLPFGAPVEIDAIFEIG